MTAIIHKFLTLIIVNVRWAEERKYFRRITYINTGRKKSSCHAGRDCSNKHQNADNALTTHQQTTSWNPFDWNEIRLANDLISCMVFDDKYNNNNNNNNNNSNKSIFYLAGNKM